MTIHFWPKKERHSGQPVSRYWRHQLAERVYHSSLSLPRRLVPKLSACPSEYRHSLTSSRSTFRLFPLRFPVPGSLKRMPSACYGNPLLELPRMPRMPEVQTPHPRTYTICPLQPLKTSLRNYLLPIEYLRHLPRRYLRLIGRSMIGKCCVGDSLYHVVAMLQRWLCKSGVGGSALLLAIRSPCTPIERDERR